MFFSFPYPVSYACSLLDHLQRQLSDPICRHPHGFNGVAKESTKWNWKWRHANLAMFDIHLWRLLWLGCPVHARVEGNDQVDTLVGITSHHKWLASWSRILSVEEPQALTVGTKAMTSGKARTSQVAHILIKDLECWGAWGTNCGYKGKDITPWTAWKREL